MTKPDADRIARHLEFLKQQPWLGQARSWWPNYLFHVTDVLNAGQILTLGVLMSRARCEASGGILVDSASSKVLGGTDPRWKNFVRFYFRPRTPFQYQIEGFRPIANRGSLNAYCPMPIVFLFDSFSILARPDSLFSDGNLAATHANVGKDAEFFESLPFSEIYHDSWLTEEEKRSIIYHRHAEVAVPSEIDLSSLRRVWCRTPAEQETLQSLVHQDVWESVADRVGSSPRPNLFNRRWTFLERVKLADRLVVMKFNPWTVTPGPFVARVERRNDYSGEMGYWTDETFSTANYNGVFTIDPTLPNASPRYSVKLWLDDRLAYAGSYSGEAVRSLM